MDGVKDMRKCLAKIDWNSTLTNKTATECWNIVKSDIDCIVDKFVPLKKHGKLSKKKHLLKEFNRKIKYKLMMWKYILEVKKSIPFIKKHYS